MNIQILCLSLVYKDNTQKFMSYKEFRELFPLCEWLTIPKRSFGSLLSGSPSGKMQSIMNKRLMKVYIKAERINYKSSFYHKCVVKELENQSKLNEFIKNRSDAKVSIVHEAVKKYEIDEDEIDPDTF